MKFSKKNVFLFLFTFYITVFSTNLLAVELVKVVGHQYSPYQNTDGTGFQNELVKEVFKHVGMQAKIDIIPPLRTIKEFYDSNYAVCADGETITDADKNFKLDVRKKTYWNVPIGLMYYKPNLNANDIKLLKEVKNFSEINPKLSILSYGGYDPYTSSGFKGKVFIKSNSPQQTYSMVKGGRMDLGFEVLGVTPFFLKEDGLINDLENWGFLSAWIYVPQYVAFNGKHPKGAYYEKKFNEGLSIIKKNGIYISLYEKFYGKNNVPRSAVDDPDNEISEQDKSKLVDNLKFDMNKFLRQKRDKTGLIIEFVD